MTYAYDLTLNFNTELFEFFEWQKDDAISHIKRVPLIRIKPIYYNDILNNDVSFKNDFLLLIFNKSELYTNSIPKIIPYACLLTDGYRSIALVLDNYGKIIKYSSLLLDEEEDILYLSKRLSLYKLDYEIIKEGNNINFNTRQETKIIKYITKELRKSYDNKEYNKLKYLYYEYFNEQIDDYEKIYQCLLDEMKGEITENIYKLYDLIKLSYGHKIV